MNVLRVFCTRQYSQSRLTNSARDCNMKLLLLLLTCIMYCVTETTIQHARPHLFYCIVFQMCGRPHI